MLLPNPEQRWRRYYRVPTAGKKAGWGRSESYRQAEAGVIPTERFGKLLLVPKRRWDRKVRRLKSRTRGIDCAGLAVIALPERKFSS
jgi:hypothetical protein